MTYILNAHIQIIGATCYSSPAKARKKVFGKKNYAFDSNDFAKNNDKEKVK